MKEHYELEHSDCLKCYDTFKKSSSVKCQNCTTRKPYECQFCKSRYTNLHEHASKCQYAFPWICSICVGVRFSNQWSLNRHNTSFHGKEIGKFHNMLKISLD